MVLSPTVCGVPSSLESNSQYEECNDKEFTFLLPSGSPLSFFSGKLFKRVAGGGETSAV